MACAVAKESAIALQLSAIRWEDENEFSGFRTRQPLFCQQCSQPECYYACPLKDQALCIDAKTGARYVNKEKCNGCGICQLACPFEVKRINVDTEKKKAIKCDLCKDRAEGPVCIGVCDRLALSLVKAETRL
jgi:Fe-S-cluster-containing hydrogenase component 2